MKPKSKHFSFFPSMRFPSYMDEATEEDWAFPIEESGLSIYEDENNIYVEAALPGMEEEHIDITFDRGTLWIRAEKKEEEKEKKYYRKAASNFSYRVIVPGDIDETKEAEATYENGIMKITFPRKEKATPQKIRIKRK